MGKYCCAMDFINEFMDFVLVMIMCGVLRIGLSILFKSCNTTFMNFCKAQYMHEVPLIYDPLAFGLVICCNLAPVINFVRKSIPRRQKIQLGAKYLECVNFFLICFTPYPYN